MTITLFNCWAEENISPCDWSDRRKFHNYCAVVKLLEDGTEEREYLKISTERDLFFNFNMVKENDIIVASCWNTYKKRGCKLYYIVKKVTSDSVELSEEFTTYRKAFKAK